MLTPFSAAGAMLMGAGAVDVKVGVGPGVLVRVKVGWSGGVTGTGEAVPQASRRKTVIKNTTAK